MGKHQHSPLNKLQGWSSGVAGLADLQKRQDAIEKTVSVVQKRIKQLWADVELLERSASTTAPRRAIQ